MSVWTVLVRYATKIEPGVIEVEYEVDDLEDVATIIKQGPSGFSSVAYIHVRRGDLDRWPLIPIEGGDQVMLESVEDRDPETELDY